jgi:phosphoribosylformimino-5-aminoimidazole carboxamide ribotide isomerase
VILLPAIDVRDGRAVRLEQGDFGRETVYADSPLAAARSWVEAGARWLHVVDLDGARAGEPRSLAHLRSIRSELGVPVQYGGGLRSLDHVAEAVDAGADRVVLGTVALRDPDLVADAVRRWPHAVTVAVDVRSGMVAVSGWEERTEVTPQEVIESLQARGVRRFVYTSVDRDGTLEGLDAGEVARVASVVKGSFLYSGGIASLGDLRALVKLGLANLAGVISGKALYERRFGVEDAQHVLDGKR